MHLENLYKNQIRRRLGVGKFAMDKLKVIHCDRAVTKNIKKFDLRFGVFSFQFSSTDVNHGCEGQGQKAH